MVSLSRLIDALPPDDVRAFCAEALDRVAAHDRRTGDELLRTLELYLRCGTLAGAARGLSTHRNTVRQRIRRIERLAGADLGDPESRLHLSFALRCRSAGAGEDGTPARRTDASAFGQSDQKLAS